MAALEKVVYDAFEGSWWDKTARQSPEASIANSYQKKTSVVKLIEIGEGMEMRNFPFGFERRVALLDSWPSMLMHALCLACSMEVGFPIRGLESESFSHTASRQWEPYTVYSAGRTVGY